MIQNRKRHLKHISFVLKTYHQNTTYYTKGTVDKENMKLGRILFVRGFKFRVNQDKNQALCMMSNEIAAILSQMHKG